MNTVVLVAVSDTVLIVVVAAALLEPTPIQTARLAVLLRLAHRAVSQSPNSQVFQAKNRPISPRRCKPYQHMCSLVLVVNWDSRWVNGIHTSGIITVD